MLTNPVNDIDQYIDHQPENIRIILEKVRQTIKKAVPEAEEVISYQMPAFRYHGMVAWYAAFKNHYSVFFNHRTIIVFKEELEQYQLMKAGLRLPYDKPVPVRLISKLAKYGAMENLAKAKLKNLKKKSPKSAKPR